MGNVDGGEREYMASELETRDRSRSNIVGGVETDMVTGQCDTDVTNAMLLLGYIGHLAQSRSIVIPALLTLYLYKKGVNDE